MDAEAVPAYLEIPVELRASIDGGQVLRFHGWYRLRAQPGDDAMGADGGLGVAGDSLS